jgi:hypothetical protein
MIAGIAQALAAQIRENAIVIPSARGVQHTLSYPKRSPLPGPLMNLLRSFLVVGLTAVVSACADAPDESESDEDLAALSSQPPKPEELSAVVSLLFQGCTATRVGPRHLLTAAHCVTESPTVARPRPSFVPGADLYIGNGPAVLESTVGPGTERVQRVVVERTYIAPKWNEELARGRIAHDQSGPEGPPDAALVLLTEKSAKALVGIAEAPIDLRTPALGSRAFLAGYGCDADFITRPLGVQVRTLESGDALVARRLISSTTAEQLPRSYHLTVGRPCKGNSGAPVVRRTRTGFTVIGVHSLSSQGDRPESPSFETRLDAASRDDVGSYFRSLGARTVGTAREAHFGGCRAFVGTAETDKIVCGRFLERFDAEGGERAFGLPTSEARLEPFGTAWRWSQRFERARLSLTATGVTLEPLRDPCFGAPDGEHCAGVRSEDEGDLRKVLRCAQGKTTARRFCTTACDPAGTSAAVTCR